MYRSGEIAHEMFFIVSGSVDELSERNKVIFLKSRIAMILIYAEYVLSIVWRREIGKDPK